MRSISRKLFCLFPLTAALLTGNAYAGLVAHYDFGDGSVLNDSLGGSSLTETGSIAANPDGYSAQVEDDEFLYGDLNNNAEAYSVSLWFKPANALPSDNSALFSSTGSNDWQIEYVGGIVRMNADAGISSSATSLALNTWYHVVMATDGTGFDLYITEQGQATPLAILSESTGDYDMSDFRLGMNRAQNHNWEGDYASVKLYDSALGATDIQALLNAGPEATGAPLVSISTFETADAYVDPGTSVHLTWEAENYDSLVLNPGNIDVTAHTSNGLGSTSVIVNTSTDYTLTATKGAVVSTSSLTIDVGAPRPNLIIFLVDDLGITDTSVAFILDGNGNPVTHNFNDFYQTPNIETLASTGMRFTSAYAYTICSPSRASIMTGRTAARHAISNFIPASSADWPTNWREDGIDATDVTLPATLQQNGYRTIHCGKGHFSKNTFSIEDMGFDINIGGVSAGEPDSYTNWSEARVPNVPGAGTGTFLTQALAIEANKAIEDSVNAGKPFFLYMSFYAVHAVNGSTPRFPVNPHATGDYSDAINTEHLGFATMVEGMDMALGAIRQKVIDLGVGEDTFVIFLGDNGTDSPAAGANGLAAGSFNDYPMRGKKGFKWEGGARVPLIASWITPNASNVFQQATPVVSDSIEDDLIAIWDVPVTMLAAAGVENPVGFGEDGHDLAPYFSETVGEHRPQEIAIHFPHNRGGNDGSASYFSWLRQGDMKLIYNFYHNSHELYDLATDPTESNNLAGTDLDRTMALTRRLAQMLDSEWGVGPLKPANTVRVTDNVIEIPSTPAVDLDGDGAADSTEDTNLNGLVDSTETNPDDEDTDGDSTLDGVELIVGTDPLNRGSYFYLQQAMLPAGDLQLTWPSQPANTFDILFSPDLSDWTAVHQADYAADSGSTTSYSTSLPIGGEKTGFFVVVLQ